METEEWTCVKKVKEPKKAAQEDVKIEVGDSQTSWRNALWTAE